MAASNDKPTGANKVVSNRVTKFRLPERTSRPSDDAYFDRVLSAVERKETQPTEAETAKNDSPEETSIPASEATSAPIQLHHTEAANSAARRAETPQDNATSSKLIHTSVPSLPWQVHDLHDDTAKRSSSRRDSSSTSLPRSEFPSFAEFKKRWSLFLTDTHMNLCEEIFRNTAAVGRDNYDTTASKLCQAVSKSRRHTFLLLQQLEKMGFVTRKEIKENNRLLGIRIWFHPSPIQS